MKISYKEEKIVINYREVPDHFGHDDSKRGQIVDILIGGKGFRNDLFTEDREAIHYAVERLTDAYAKATKILALFCEAKN